MPEEQEEDKNMVTLIAFRKPQSCGRKCRKQGARQQTVTKKQWVHRQQKQEGCHWQPSTQSPLCCVFLPSFMAKVILAALKLELHLVPHASHLHLVSQRVDQQSSSSDRTHNHSKSFHSGKLENVPAKSPLSLFPPRAKNPSLFGCRVCPLDGLWALSLPPSQNAVLFRSGFMQMQSVKMRFSWNSCNMTGVSTRRWHMRWAWEYICVISALVSLRQEDLHVFEASVGYIVGGCLWN